MKDYDIVVKERYDKEQIGGEKTISNVYSLFNNTGFCGAMNAYALLRKIIRYITGKTGKQPSELRLLDVGCGKGIVIRMLSELVESPQNVYGTELSKNRIAHCKKMNSSIDVKYADVTKPLPFDFSFDCIFSFDVLMHLKTKEQVEAALNSIYSNIDGGGTIFGTNLTFILILMMQTMTLTVRDSR